MKKLFFLGLMLSLCISGFSQKGSKAIGLNLGYGTEIKSISLGAKFNYSITEPIRVSPSFNYFIKKDGLSEWEVNADVHYLFNVAPKLNVYPLAGLTFQGWKFDWGLDDWGEEFEDIGGSEAITRFGVNLGGGIDYSLTNKIGIGLEAKYVIVSDFDQFVIGLNIMYKF